jgi:hypothetical protein
MKVTQTLPNGIRFLTGSLVTDNSIPHTLDTVTLSGTTQVIFDL